MCHTRAGLTAGGTVTQKTLQAKPRKAEGEGGEGRGASPTSMFVKTYGVNTHYTRATGVTGWLNWYSVGLKIQRTEVQIPSGAQEKFVSFSK